MNNFNKINTGDLLSELTFKTTRSSGSGGQNVNKVSTKVILIFDILNSTALDEDSKLLIKSRLVNKISKTGLLQMSSSKERSQYMNKKAVIQKFLQTISISLEIDNERIKTKPRKSAIEKRLNSKTKLSEKKKLRKLNTDNFD